ncbi:unnamed protein product [Rhizophagus irregularis]|uniref:Uncharacterized protein n=1 Tax=Rhizophagus irregularis TaxID=588596 RepID=A0A915Z1F0_9GLOM|nr:unnamed protein product [Rhizophagus irregularis]CAB5358743.1 unnamed protein product [Rhizophagus irregularis]
MSYNNKCNKRIRSGSPDNYEEEYIALILDDSSNICEKENEKNIEAEQINKFVSYIWREIMEGVENTSSKGEALTASPQQPMAMDIVNDNTTNKQGLDSSVHAKNTDKEQTVDQENDNIG